MSRGRYEAERKAKAGMFLIDSYFLRIMTLTIGGITALNVEGAAST